jgi:hypothetical protein
MQEVPLRLPGKMTAFLENRKGPSVGPRLLRSPTRGRCRPAVTTAFGDRPNNQNLLAVTHNTPRN